MSRISDLIQPWVQSTPDHPAIQDAEGAWSYRQLDAAVGETAAWLSQQGVRPGDRVLLVSENCRAYAALLFALTRLDAWPVLVNARLAAAEIAAIGQHAGPRLAIFTPSRRAEAHAGVLGARHLPAGLLGPIATGPLDAAAEPEPLAADPSRRVGAVLYTSGTTGRPRGVMLSHRGLIFAAQAAAKIRCLSPTDRLLGALPMMHSSGLSLVLLAGLSAGAGIDIVPRVEPVTLLQWLPQRRVTVWIGAPAMFAQMVDYARFRGLERVAAPALRHASSCSAPLPLETKCQVEALLGQVLHNGYGVTECSPGICATRLDAPRQDTSVGPPYPGVELQIMDPEARPVPDGDAGEIWVRGPNLMNGYYRAPEETAEVVDGDGWFHTGDLGKRADGALFLLGRTKELILRFGFNVYPSEIESALEAHPAVQRAAVLAQPVAGAEGGEEIVAFLQLVRGAGGSSPEITAWLRPRLAHYKLPGRIIEVEALPLTPTGKVQKETLRALLSPPLAR
ncbi:MAG: class I adenylate-forming enzyme family protein [Terriglobales bacterium]